MKEVSIMRTFLHLGEKAAWKSLHQYMKEKYTRTTLGKNIINKYGKRYKHSSF